MMMTMMKKQKKKKMLKKERKNIVKWERCAVVAYVFPWGISLWSSCHTILCECLCIFLIFLCSSRKWSRFGAQYTILFHRFAALGVLLIWIWIRNRFLLIFVLFCCFFSRCNAIATVHLFMSRLLYWIFSVPMSLSFFPFFYLRFSENINVCWKKNAEVV